MSRRVLVLVRHAQASFGASDYDALSDAGHEQARVLGETLRARWPEVTRVVSGGMRRHKQTAEGALAAAGLKLPVELDAAWDEYDHTRVLAALDPRYADREALAQEVLAADVPARAFHRIFARALARWASGEHDDDYAETWTAFARRVGDALTGLHARDEPVSVVFTSGGPILAACQAILRTPTEEALRMGWALANGSITVLSAGDARWRLTSFNEHAHFTGERANLLTFR